MLSMKTFTSAVLLITTPSLLVYPQNSLPTALRIEKVSPEVSDQSQQSETLLTYDGIMHLLDELESGELEKRCSDEDLDRINQFLALLAKEGVLPGDFSNELALEADIHELLEVEDDLYEYAFSIGRDDEYIIVPAIFNDHGDVILCKSWAKKQWKKTKKFVHKHKKEIIIGAIVVVAAVVVVGVVVAASAGAAAAAASGSNKDEESKPVPKEETPLSPSIPIDVTPALTAPNNAPLLKEALDEHIFSFKEFLAEDRFAQESGCSQDWDDRSFGEKARELGGFFAHQAFDGISDLAGAIPQLCEEIKDLGSRILPEGLVPSNKSDFMRDPNDNYENLLARGHKTIDMVFSVDQADLYTSEAKANDLMKDFALGIIPLPGMISSNGSINSKGFSDLGKAIDKADFTKAGRGLMKHGYRQASVFPKPIGNPAYINEHGQKILEKILNHPEKKIVQYTHKRYGPVIEIEAPKLGGARFTGDGKEMIGFLEPYWFLE